MNTKCIFFDTTDTLYSSPELEKKMKESPIEFIMLKMNVTREEALAVFESGKNKAIEKGTLTTKSNILKEAGFNNSEYQDFNANVDITQYLKPIEETVQTITYLASKYELGIITNINNHFVQKVLKAIGLSNTLFSHYVTSDDTPEAKPSLAPFLIAAEKAKVLPEEIVYVGDNIKKDMEPAKKVGMKTILLDYKNIGSNKPEVVDYCIKSIKELKDIF
ncbi:MAG: HAD family hydrolase [Oscillospiraceae bacterium]|nr:HAD family hydrolase [Oscillospiraceae bacterium]